ncbi:MAG TPA: methylated-DNA--[protein]-cysteine S-methyltransferase [Acidobacteriota bacterium]|nr:methylated-DNA--[protein]-cysteine S-methyltransferase [Acidobacteriota bacterium]
MKMEEVIVTAYGPLRITHDGKRINSIEFLWKAAPGMGEKNGPLASRFGKQLDEYSKGKRKDFDVDFLPLPKGTDFQEKVWKITSKIPYGKTLTYKNIAEKLGNPRLARAVGNAMKANRLPFIIPCHRVVAENGLGGYAGKEGMSTKRKLLLLEKSAR